MKKFKKIIWLTILVVVLFFGLKFWFNFELSAVSSDKISKDIVIPKGQSLSQIANNLKQENLIKSSFAFQVMVRQKGLGSKIQAGFFRLSPSMSGSEIVKILTSGSEGVWVRLLEGWRAEEEAEEVNKQLKIDKEEFLKNAQEGYMFPDSYLIPREATVSYIIDTLKNTFDQRFSDDLRLKITKQGLTKKQGIILASIVEREARSAGARQMVASILLKRFKIGMGLNADATIQYALGYQKDEKSWWKRHLSLEDLKINSPYNTYIHSGLPPAPISSPSLSSLTAVAEADSSTPYLYYYHDLEGNSYYGKTLEEHHANVVNHP